MGLPFPKGRLAGCGALAAAYFLAAKAALLLAIPPGYATAVWPAAGIALAAMLLRGQSLWPGILAGSFAANLSTNWEASGGAALAAAIGAGATLQAAVGARMVRGAIGDRDALKSPRDIFLLLALGGPVSCALSASIGVTALVLSGAVALPDSPFNWLTWWVGDSTGAALFSPILLAWASGERSARRKLTMTLPTLILLAGLVAVFIVTSRMELDRLELQLHARAAAVGQAAARQLQFYPKVLGTVAGQLEASPSTLAQPAFSRLASRIMLEQPAIVSLQWVPRVPAAERDAFERAARGSGRPGYALWEPAPSGERRPAARRPEAFPVHLLHWRDKRWPVDGFDLASSPARLAAMEAARDSGLSQITPAMPLLISKQGERGLLLFSPVYAPPGPDPAARRARLRGFLLAVFTVEGMAAEAFPPADSGLRLRLVDVSRGAEDVLHDSDPSGPPPALTHAIPIEIGGRKWSLKLLAPPAAAPRSWLAWSVLCLGLLFAIVLQTLMLVLAGRSEGIEALVSERTAQLSAARQRFELAVAGSNDGIWDWDIRTNEAYFSPRWKSMLGYADGEVADAYASWESLLHPEDLGPTLAKLKDYLEGRAASYEAEFRMRHKDGNWRWILARGAALRDADGKPYRMSGSHTDVTRNKMLETQLIQTEKMSLASQLVGGVAHSFNNMLTGAMGLAYLIHKSLGPGHPSSEDVAEIITVCQKAAQLVKNLLTISRSQPASRRALDLSEAVRSWERMLRAALGESIALRLDLTDDGAPALADPAQLEQAVMNLAINAKEAMKGKGELSLRTFARRCSEELVLSHGKLRRGLYAALQVRDTGPGLSPELAKRAFEPFFSTKGSKSRGLGLAIVYGVIQEHEGAIDLKSAPGGGFDITLYFPAAESGEAEPGLPSPRAGSPGLILLAEDEPRLRVVVRRMLEGLGYSVLAAEDGQAAVELFSRHREKIAFCLFDILMPRLQGHEAYQKIVELRPDIPVLFMSGFTGSAAHEAIRRENLPFLPKPFTAETLKEALAAAFGKIPG